MLSSRKALAAEDGFGIIEVLVSAMMVVLISLGVFSAIDAAGRTADVNKSRSAASNLAHDDQDRLRSLKITDLARRTETRTVTVDNEAYTVASKGEYVAGSAGSDNCASDDEAPKYVKITSTVTWPNMGSVKPVEENSLRATPSGTIGNFGSLAVDINDRAGAGQAGIAVTITPDAAAAAAGGVTTTGTTNDQGCIVFGYIRSGRYTVSFAKPGYVLAANPNAGSVNDVAVVASDAIASKSYQYDVAGRATVNYRTNDSFGSGAWATSTNGTGFTIANSSLGTPDFKTFTHAGAASGSSGLVNFPFTGGYEAWAGVCAGYKPASAGDLGSLTIPPGGTGTATVREFRLRVQVQRRTSRTGSTNYGTTPNDGRTTVTFSPTTPGCTDSVAASWVSDTGDIGTSSSNYSTWEAIVPWGSYSVCAQYGGGGGNRGKVDEADVTTDTSSGSVHGNKLEIPFNLRLGYSC